MRQGKKVCKLMAAKGLYFLLRANNTVFWEWQGNHKGEHAMQAKVQYRLSEAGQRAALAAGLAAQVEQAATIEVGNGDLELFAVDAAGNLSADATTGWAGAAPIWNGEYAGWKSHYFDAPPSPADLVLMLRTRRAKRAEYIAADRAERKAQEQTAAAEKDAVRAAALERVRSAKPGELDSGVRTSDMYVSGVQLSSQQYPEVAAYLADYRQREADRIASAERLKRIEEAAKEAAFCETQYVQDGKYAFDCPSSPYFEEWAKHVTSVDPAGRGGFALQGEWLKCLGRFALPAGEIVVVGGKEWRGSRKRGEWVSSADIYLVTPAGLRHVAGFKRTDGAVTRCAELLAQTPAERVKEKLESTIALSEKKVAALRALDRGEFTAELEIIDARIAGWQQLAAMCESALIGGAGDERITDIDSAAAAIVSAGYRALSKIHHPDAGGSAATMALLSQARRQLVELLKLAGEVK